MSASPHPAKTAQRKKAQAGFSVLEALAAVALIAAAFLPLLALQGQLTRTVVAIERAEASVSNMESALSYLRVVNPSLVDQGEAQVGDALLRWRARPISAEKTVLDQGGAPGRFAMRLYEIEATFLYSDGREADFTLTAIGWRPTAPFSATFN